jgi:membrane-associated protease RseP (regulator of RpoE activity)
MTYLVRKWIQTGVLLVATTLVSPHVAAEDDSMPPRTGVTPHPGAAAKAVQRMEDARKKLDEAAAELSRAVAEVYSHPDPDGERAFLGILLEDHHNDSTGIQLGGVTPGGGAAAAGLAAGDTLVGIGDVRLAGQKNPAKLLLKAMEDVKPGDKVRVTYLRGGNEYVAEITTTGMFRSALASIEPKLAPWIEEKGIQGIARLMLDPETNTSVLIDVKGDLAAYFGVDSGVLVLHVPSHPDSLRPGDILLEIASRAPANAKDARARLLEGDEVKNVRIRRRGQESTLAIDPEIYRVDRQPRVFIYHFDDLEAPPAPLPPPPEPPAPKSP